MTDNHEVESLTERELDIINGIAEGLTNREIAEQYVISVATVRWYTKQIYRKLDVNNRTQASVRARELGIIGDDETPDESAHVDNLPTYHSKFIGRQREIKEITAMLTDPQTRLITIVGPGGMGKTRLGVEVARNVKDHFSDGIYFIPLGPTTVTNASFMQAIRRSLNLSIGNDQTIFAPFTDKEVLLLFDNFEQSIEQRDILLDVLEAIPQAKILVTSQVSLNLGQEWVRRLESLINPQAADPEALADALDLFEDRVQRVNSNFTLDAHYDCAVNICKLVYGMPLAIELAATWLKTVSCEDVLTEMRENIEFLSTNASDVESRHQSIDAVFQHTWHLLSDEEQRIFKRLSVFRGEFGYKAAQQVAGASLRTLSSLVDWSLIRQTQNNLYRLHELLRHYGEQKLKIDQHGKHSNMAFAMVSLINGDFNQVESMANEFLEDSSDEMNLDKGFAMAILSVIAGANEDYRQCLQLGESSLLLTSESPIPSLFSYLGMGIGYCGTGDYATAWSSIYEALKYAQSLQSTAFINLCIPVVALTLAFEDDLETATALVGLVRNHPVELPDWMANWDLFIQLYLTIDEEREKEDFERLWQYGQTLDPQDVAMQILEGNPII